jgi:hypothetical protein
MGSSASSPSLPLFRRELERVMGELRLTNGDVAAKSGLSAATVSRIRSGHYPQITAGLFNKLVGAISDDSRVHARLLLACINDRKRAWLGHEHITLVYTDEALNRDQLQRASQILIGMLVGLDSQAAQFVIELARTLT